MDSNGNCNEMLNETVLVYKKKVSHNLKLVPPTYHQVSPHTVLAPHCHLPVSVINWEEWSKHRNHLTGKGSDITKQTHTHTRKADRRTNSKQQELQYHHAEKCKHCLIYMCVPMNCLRKDKLVQTHLNNENDNSLFTFEYAWIYYWNTINIQWSNLLMKYK